MSYSGSTAASSVANPPINITQGPLASVGSTATGIIAGTVGGKQGGRVWFYSSTNPSTAVEAANFFSDGLNLGMRPGDFVIGNYYSSAGSSMVTYMFSVKTVSTSGASVSAASVISSTYA